MIILDFIKDLFPVSFISLLTIGLGYGAGTLVARRRRKPWEKLIEEINK